MMTLLDDLTMKAEPVPLRMADGAWRVGGSRITLDLIVDEYENGMAPEDMVRAYDTLDLADVYAAIAYYLKHRNEVRAYLDRREAEAAALRAKIEALHPPLTSAELLARSKNSGVRVLRLASDADVRGPVIRGLQAKEPSLDLVLSESVHPRGTPDEIVLAWAADERRVLITNDRNTMIGFAFARLIAGLEMPGPHRHDTISVNWLND